MSDTSSAVDEPQVALDRHRSAFDQTGDGIWIADQSGRFLDVNASGCALLGYSLPEHLGLHLHDMVRGPERSRLTALVTRLAAREKITDVWELRHADRHFVLLELSHTFTPDGLWCLLGRPLGGRPIPVGGAGDAEQLGRLASLEESLARRDDRLASHQHIEQAKGMLMGVLGYDEDGAFDLLVTLSQETNVKLRVLAEDVVAVLRRVPPSRRSAEDAVAAIVSLRARLRATRARSR